MSTKSCGREFMQKTEVRYLGPSDQAKGVRQPALELPVPDGVPLVDLPEPATLELLRLDLRDAIEQRKSVRRYAEVPLSLGELSHLLWCTAGVKQMLPSRTRRNVPSAGARHALETFLFVNNVETLSVGLYRFVASKHKLALVSDAAHLAEKVFQATGSQPFVATAAVTFIWVAVAERMTWRYGERGYRYLHLDAGHICQNLYLAAEAVDAGVCALAHYHDQELNQVLQVDGENQFAVYLATVGKRWPDLE